MKIRTSVSKIKQRLFRYTGRLLGRNVAIAEGRLNWFGIPLWQYERSLLSRFRYYTGIPNFQYTAVEHTETQCDISDDALCYILSVDCGELVTVDRFSDPDISERFSYWRGYFAAALPFYRSWLKSQNISNLLLVHGFMPETICLRHLAIRMGIQAVVIEPTARKDRILWDTLSLIPVNRNLAANYYWRYQDDVTNEEANNYWEESWNSIDSMKRHEHQTSGQASYVPKVKKPVFLFLGQVYTDASIIFGIDSYQTPENLIHCLLKVAEEKNAELVIKLHPKENSDIGDPLFKRPYNNVTFRQMMKIPQVKTAVNSGRVVVDSENKMNTYRLIEKADVVITLNSQAGLEAAAFGKPVVTCGKGFYTDLGFTLDAHHPDDLLHALTRALQTGESLSMEARRFYTIFFTRYCVPYDAERLVALLFDGSRRVSGTVSGSIHSSKSVVSHA